jgi:transcriptional regulator NrdR family protein
MTVVIKRNNKKERFDEKKIKRSIDAAAKEADLPEARRKSLMDRVAVEIIEYAKNEKEVRAIELREKILAKLDKIEPSVANSWRDFDRESKGLA